MGRRGLLTTLQNRPRARAFRSPCPLHRKPGSQHCVIGCDAVRRRLHSQLRLIRRTTTGQTAAHRRLDRRRDDLCQEVAEGAK